ncbi:MAG: alkaline shock response membrane anchor protein AmaP [Pseudonocardia sp.]|nr:alkaline shock response membrane anchor protein AmaP [Pseudonocardia sp.]
MTVSMEKDGPGSGATAAAPAPPAGTLRRRSRSAVARSAGGDRSLLVLIGLVLLVLGVLVALLSYGVFGAARAGRPILDPVVADVVTSQLLIVRLVAIAVGVLALILGLVWAARSLRPERRPDLVLDPGPETAITVDSSAAADALATQAAALPGVGRAKARLVGSPDAPAVRMSMWLADDADVRDVLDRLDTQVLSSARSALGIAALPVAVRLELDKATTGPRVS